MSIIRKKLGYIANKKETIIKDNGRETVLFETPKEFYELYMPLQDDESLENYGTDVDNYLRMFVDYRKWYGKIHQGDRAYLIDEETTEIDVKTLVTNATEKCTNANYQVKSVVVQNLKLKVEFEKINKGDK